MSRAKNANLTDSMVSALKRCRPRTDADGTFDVVRSTTEVLSRVKYVLLTGIEPFDAETGGLPFGRLVEIYGLEASGKTAMCIRSMIRAQQRHIYERVATADGSTKLIRVDKDVEVVILFIDNEQSVDEDEKITFHDDETGHDTVLDVVLARCDTVDHLFKMAEIVILKMAAHQKENPEKICFVVIVADTVAGTSSKEEIKADWSKEDYQRQPKQLRRGFRRIQRAINRHNVLMICTNQVSDNYKAKRSGNTFLPQESDFSTFGGRALKYYASLRVFVYQISPNYRVNAGARFSEGILIGFLTAKNRFLKPYRHGRFVLLFNGGLSSQFSLLETLIFLKLVTVEKGVLSFRFQAAKIATTTFSNGTAADLENEDELAARNRNPRCQSRADWPGFYAAHEADMRLLWAKALEIVFGTELSDLTEDSDLDSYDLDEDDVDVVEQDTIP